MVPQSALRSLLGNESEDSAVLNQNYYAVPQPKSTPTDNAMDSVTSELLAKLGIFDPRNVSEGYSQLLMRLLGR